MQELRMSQKRTCDRCVELDMTDQYHVACGLGYEIDQKALKPAEPCPKPLTKKDSMRCGRKYLGEEPIKDFEI